MTREEAVAKTKDIMSHMSHAEATEICTKGDGIDALESARMYAWSTGVGGWYYNVENNTFCTDMIIKSTLLTYMSALKHA